jgi:ferritin-like metal-binding protein YciE
MKALRKLLLDELAEMYSSEHFVARILPAAIRAATCPELQRVLERHLDETEGQATQLERVFEAFDQGPREKNCAGMTGLVDELEEIIAENEDSSAINSAIIAAIQKIEHYEIASYGALHAWAELLENPDAAEILEEILDQEKAADYALNALAIAKNQETLADAAVGGLA